MHMSAQSKTYPTHTKIICRTKGVTSTVELQRFLNRQMRSSLGRFQHRLSEIAVFVEDVNGPRGGIDMQCRIDLRLVPRGRLSVSAQSANEFMAISKAAERARMLLDRQFKRAQTRRRTPRNRISHRNAASEDLVVSESQTTVVSVNPAETANYMVAIGSIFDILDLHSNERDTYTLTRPSDADITRNRISSATPLGRAVYGRCVGDTVEVNAPGGVFRVRVDAIDHWSTAQFARAG